MSGVIIQLIFALTKKYTDVKNKYSFTEIQEFKNLVREFHNYGIEVILDVVYNHTAESGHGGKSIILSS